MRKRKKIILIILLIVMWIIWDNLRVEVTPIKITDPNLPVEKFKIAHISDIHNSHKLNEVVTLIKKHQPDLIAITGDLIDEETKQLDDIRNFLVALKEIAPVKFSSGNHDFNTHRYLDLVAMLAELEIDYLQNEEVEIRNGLWLAGLNDPSAEFDSNFIKASDKYRLVLSHRPELFDHYVNLGINVVLSGHAHGGQFRFLFLPGLIAPNQGFFPKYTKGLYREAETRMIVSAGIGNSVIPLRYSNPSHINIIELINPEY